MLGDSRCHGFYRFFIFQSIIVLLALNTPYWVQPRGWVDKVASVLLILSVLHGYAGYRLLCTTGHPTAANRRDTDLLFENTTVLVDIGIFRWIRHPMYGALLYLAIGTYLKGLTNPAPLRLVATTAALVATLAFVHLAARAEERECRERFGRAYARYCATTRRFIPFVW